MMTLSGLRWGTILAALLLAPSLCGAEKPNFVLILCDNLGYGDIEPFRPETPHRTPHLKRLASEGMKLTHFYVSAGVCTPSRASIMTGCYAQRVGMHRIPVDHHVLRPVSPHGLHPGETTVAEVLRESGYATALIGKWHLGDQPEFLPTRQGFDTFFGIPYSDDMTAREDWNGRVWPPLPLVDGERVVEAPADRNTLTKRYTERALAFMRKHKDGPFFLLLSHAMPGSTRTPYASDAFRGKSSNGPWGDAVEEIDWSTGEIVGAIRNHGIERRTLVFWTSDNGAPNNPNDIRRGSNKPLYGRGYTTSEGGMRVPAIAWWPGRIPRDTESDLLATAMDFLPTFARLGGGGIPEARKIDGRDICPILFAEEGAVSPHTHFYYYQLDQLQAIRDARWKLFLPLENPVRHPRFRKGPTEPLLFDLVADTGCVRNVAKSHPEIVARLLAHAESARADLGDAGRAGKGQRDAGKVANPRPQIR